VKDRGFTSVRIPSQEISFLSRFSKHFNIFDLFQQVTDAAHAYFRLKKFNHPLFLVEYRKFSPGCLT